MNLIKPKKLEIGQTIGLLSVSGDIREPERIQKAKSYFESKGFNVVVSSTTYEKDRYFAGTDKERIDALHSFFEDKNIDAIVCTRGGYGLIRIINYIDYELIKNNPKILVGYSDITALLLMIYKKTGLLTFHGPMSNGDFGENEINNYTESNFYEMLQKAGKYSSLEAINSNVYKEGLSRGVLWGGNLSTIVSLAGQDFTCDEKFILFVEDLNEPVYKIDKMFTQLLNIPKFKNNLAGIALGKFTSIDREDYLCSLFYELAEKLNIPVCDGFNISHDKDKITLPIGVQCEFDSKNGSIKFLEDITL